MALPTKIVAFNLRAGGKAGHRVHWNQVLEAFDPEIFLVQETLHPSEYLTTAFYSANKARIHWRAAPGRRWGSAIFVRSGRLDPIDVPTIDGHVVGAKISRDNWSHKKKIDSSL